MANTVPINDRLGPGGLENVAILSTDANGNTVLVGAGGETLPMLGANTITVGAGGMYATIQAAIDYISTLENFQPYTPAVGPVTVTAWAAGASSATTNVFNSSAIELDSWFKVADDLFAYPVEQVDWNGNELSSKVRRVEASLSAVSKAITYYRQITHTILLLDERYYEDILIDANINVRFVSLRGSTWHGATTPGAVQRGANFRYGSITLGTGVAMKSDQAKAFMNDTGGWNSANCIRLRLEPGSGMRSHAADLVSPDVQLGDFHAEGVAFEVAGLLPNSHFLHMDCGGDVLILNSSLQITASKVGEWLAPESRFMDKVSGRSVVINGLDCVVTDVNATLTKVFIATGLASANCPYSLSNVSISLTHASTTVIILAEDGDTGAAANNLYLSNCRIDGLRTTGAKHLYKTTAGSALAVFASQCSGGTIDTPSTGSKTVDNTFAT